MQKNKTKTETTSMCTKFKTSSRAHEVSPAMCTKTVHACGCTQTQVSLAHLFGNTK